MITAIFTGIEAHSKNGVVYADAILIDPNKHLSHISGLGFSYEGGKFDAMWDLAQQLTDRGIELELPKRGA